MGSVYGSECLNSVRTTQHSPTDASQVPKKMGGGSTQVVDQLVGRGEGIGPAREHLGGQGIEVGAAATTLEAVLDL